MELVIVWVLIGTCYLGSMWIGFKNRLEAKERHQRYMANQTLTKQVREKQLEHLARWNRFMDEGDAPK